MQQQDNQLIIKMKRVIQSQTVAGNHLLKIISFYDPLFSNADFNIVTKQWKYIIEQQIVEN